MKHKHTRDEASLQSQAEDVEECREEGYDVEMSPHTNMTTVLGTHTHTHTTTSLIIQDTAFPS